VNMELEPATSAQMGSDLNASGDASEAQCLLQGLIDPGVSDIALSRRQKVFFLTCSGLWVVGIAAAAAAWVSAREPVNGFKPPMLIPATQQACVATACVLILLVMPWTLLFWRQVRPWKGMWTRRDFVSAAAIFLCMLLCVVSEIYARHLPTSWVLLALTTACCSAALATVALLLSRACATLLDMVVTNVWRWEQRLIYVSIMVLCIASLWTGFSDPVVKLVELSIPGLPTLADGYELCMLSDLHAGPITGPNTLQALVDQVNDLSCDAVILNGDIAEGTVSERSSEMQTLLALSHAAKDGAYFVPGNHEFYNWNEPENGRGGATAWSQWWDSHGVRSLNNTHITLPLHGPPCFTLAGVDDVLGFPSLTLALEGRNTSLPTVLMAHRPTPHIYNAAQLGVAAQISGHTHGGQVWPVQALAQKANGGYLSGLYQLNSTWLYVGDGSVSSYATRLRLLTQAEITRVVLRAGPVERSAEWRPARFGTFLGWAAVGLMFVAAFGQCCQKACGSRCKLTGGEVAGTADSA